MRTLLTTPWMALRIGIGLMATLAGLDKFFNLLADWSLYVSPMAAAVLPLPVDAFMALVGIIEMLVGVAILGAWTRLGAYAAGAWLLAVAVNLAFAGYLDIAVRDIVLALSAFTLARLTEALHDVPAAGPAVRTAGHHHPAAV